MREQTMIHLFATKGRLALMAAMLGAPLAGCATAIPATVDTSGMPNAEIALQKSMDDVGREMERIGRMQPRAAAVAMPVVVPAELDRVLSFQWRGSLDGAVTELARTIGYQASVSGPLDRQALNVTVDPAPRRVVDILRQLGDDAGAAATVNVDAQHQRLEVIHHG